MPSFLRGKSLGANSKFVLTGMTGGRKPPCFKPKPRSRYCPIADPDQLKLTEQQIIADFASWSCNYSSLSKLHKKHPLFLKFDSLFTTRFILENSEAIWLKPGQTLFEAGGTNIGLYLIMAGSIQLYLPDQEALEFGCGTIVGEEWLYQKHRFKRNLTAVCCGGQRVEA